MPAHPLDTDIVMSLRNVGVRYRRRHRILDSRKDDFWALHDVSMDIRRGEALGVVGRNGAGKSTLLRLLAGIIRPDRGVVTMNDAGYRAALLSLQVGFVPNLSGHDNAMLSGMFMGFPKKAMKAMLPGIEALAELGPLFREPVNTYSAGMRARLGFAVAIQIDPDVVLVDEVLGVGDEQFRKKSEELLKQKIKSNKTIVLVSHSRGAIMNLCNRVAWIEQGVVREVGEPREIMDRYEGRASFPIPSRAE